MDGKSSKLKVENQDGEDRISSLPDSVLCHILSYLPTKTAMATCILSSRWKLVWTSLPNLCLDDRLLLEYKRTQHLSDVTSATFENFVNRVFLLHPPVDLNKFFLHCFKLRDWTCFNFWVSAAIMRNVRDMELNLEHHDRVELPESIYTSKTLEVLKLDSDFTFKIPASGICLPSLKIFRVVMRYPRNNLIEKLFSNCPALEDLSIMGYLHGADMVAFNISSLTLKRLSLVFEDVDEFSYTEHLVVIEAPNLEHLFIRDCPLVSYLVHKPHALMKVVVNFYYESLIDFDPPDFPDQSVVQLLEGVTNAKFLSLSKGTIAALDSADLDFFPLFSNLTCLEVDIKYGWRLFPIILSSMPNLESLVFEKDIGVECEWTGQQFMPDCLNQDVGVESGWTEPSFVPHCLRSNIKTIEIRRFEGKKSQVKLIKYLLKNGEVLNSFMVTFHKKLSRKSGLKDKIARKLWKFEKGSRTCELKVFI
ncbi:F-box protein [Melia azedarach]|uniref:F-box protein n=1 Tax=Melia azedarach TaxID=155640 RepID=A0ACC1XPR5_MELAZ|nr:F-box protein [Melia azedarach]